MKLFTLSNSLLLSLSLSLKLTHDHRLFRSRTVGARCGQITETLFHNKRMAIGFFIGAADGFRILLVDTGQL